MDDLFFIKIISQITFNQKIAYNFLGIGAIKIHVILLKTHGKKYFFKVQLMIK